MTNSAGEVDDAIVSSLPNAAQFSATLPAGRSLSGNIIASKANLKAMGFAGLDGSFGVKDADITFNSAFAFDYDNSNGVGAGLLDFETVAAHEIGPALGFFSIVDTVDAGTILNLSPTPLDLYRFRNNFAGADPATTSEFTLSPQFARQY